MVILSWRMDQSFTSEAFCIANELMEEVKDLPGVTSIIFIGGLARGSMDRFSDLDLVILLKESSSVVKATIQELTAKHASKGVDIDAEVYLVDEFAGREWDEIRKWDYSHCRVIYDLEGDAARVIAEGTHMEPEDWMDRAVLSRWCCSGTPSLRKGSCHWPAFGPNGGTCSAPTIAWIIPLMC